MGYYKKTSEDLKDLKKDYKMLRKICQIIKPIVAREYGMKSPCWKQPIRMSSGTFMLGGIQKNYV